MSSNNVIYLKKEILMESVEALLYASVDEEFKSDAKAFIKIIEEGVDESKAIDLFNYFVQRYHVLKGLSEEYFRFSYFVEENIEEIERKRKLLIK